MGDLVTFLLMAAFAILSWLYSSIWFLFKVFLTIGIGWGILQSLDPFPIETVSNWQTILENGDLGIPGGTYLAWVAQNWLPIGTAVVLIVTTRSRHVLRQVVPTSHHAAFAASALANYFEVQTLTKRLMEAEAETKLSSSFGRLFWTSFIEKIITILQGVPFVPEDALPARKGEVVQYRDDLVEYIDRMRGKRT